MPQLVEYQKLENRMYSLTDEGRSILMHDLLPIRLSEVVHKKKIMGRHELRVCGS